MVNALVLEIAIASVPWVNVAELNVNVTVAKMGNVIVENSANASVLQGKVTAASLNHAVILSNVNVNVARMESAFVLETVNANAKLEAAIAANLKMPNAANCKVGMLWSFVFYQY